MGLLVTVVLVRGVAGTDAQACFERALQQVSWAGLPGVAAAVEIELKLRPR